MGAAESHRQNSEDKVNERMDEAMAIDDPPPEKRPRLIVPNAVVVPFEFTSTPQASKIFETGFNFSLDSIEPIDQVDVEFDDQRPTTSSSSAGTFRPLESSVTSSLIKINADDDGGDQAVKETWKNKKRRRLLRNRIFPTFPTSSFSRENFFTMGGTLYRKLSGSLGNLVGRNRKRKYPNEPDEMNNNLNRAPSDYSISKTQWPTPSLEAIFLPEFSNRSPVNESHFTILATIATGAFSTVYRVCVKGQLDYIFAMKTQEKAKVIAANAVEQCKAEVEVQLSLSAKCPFIATLHATWQSRNQLYSILNYVDGYGDLFVLWRDYGPFDEPTCAMWGAEIALALDFIHSEGVIYRDLKMENIVVDLDGHIQLVDFGFAKRLNWVNGERTRTICGTLPYMAPEIAHGLPYSKAVDWWAFGVLLHCLHTNSYPMPAAKAKNHRELNYSELSIAVQPDRPMFKLLEQLLCLDPANRLQSIEQIKRSEFFEDVNFEEAGDLKLSPLSRITRMQRCPSCKFDGDGSASEISELENVNGFDEAYEFGEEFDYFNERFV